MEPGPAAGLKCATGLCFQPHFPSIFVLPGYIPLAVYSKAEGQAAV